jgi:hypothetical protein
MRDLDARLLRAHEDADTDALVALYTEAGRVADNETARGFYLTHAYVFALEAGMPEARDLKQRLIDMGREPAD